MKTKKRIFIIATLIMLLLFNCISVFAKETDWVLDEMNILSEESLNYISNLNEQVFPSYNNKPQLGIMIIDEIPNGYTMTQYKLEQFNAYGVGTKEENCGVLFIIAINDREYGLEIGEGFKRGTTLRSKLETDFVDKELLRAENYEEAIMKVVYNIENVLLIAESGEYAAIDAENERISNIAGICILVLFIGVLLFYVTMKLFVKLKQVYEIKNAMIEYDYCLNAIELSYIDYSYDDVKKYLQEQVLYRDEWRHEEIFNTCLDSLYNLYKKSANDYLRVNGYGSRLEQYLLKLDELNKFDVFIANNLTSLKDIISIVNGEEDRNDEIEENNEKIISNYVKLHETRVDERISVNQLIDKMQGKCIRGESLVNVDLSELFETCSNDLIFDYEYEKFINENKDNLKHFKKSDFRHDIKNHPEYKNQVNNKFRNFNIWLMPLFVSHIAKNKAAYERRRRNNSSFNPSRRTSSSYGRSFGGGFSRGGGFSGRW